MGDVKTRFSLEGEQQYRQAMTNAANAIRVLNSEQKLATAQFKNTGDAQKYAADQARILQEKIKQQQAVVKAAQQAMKELTDKGVKENTREFQQWQTKLNNAQTALTNMQTELENVNTSFQNVTTVAQETASAVDSVGKNVSYGTVIDGIGKITDKMEAAAGKARELAGELFNTMRDAAAWADDLVTQASVYGIDTQTLQRMRYTADLIDTSVESIIKSRQKLINNMVYGNDEIQATFESLGVSTKEFVQGKYGPVVTGYRDWEDVLWDVGAALMDIDDSVEANAIATKVFGRSWNELLPLFSAGREEYEKGLAEWSTVSDENVNKLGALDDSLQKLDNEFETLKMTVLAELAPGFTTLGNAVTNLLKQFNDYLATDAGKAKLQDLSDAVTGIFEGLSNIDFDTALSAASTALTSLVDGLGWIKDNWGAVEAGLGVLAGSFAALKISEGVLTFVQLLAAGKFLLGTTAAGDAAAAGTAAGTAWGGAFAKAVMAAAPWLAFAYTVLKPGNGSAETLFDEATGQLTMAGIEDYNNALATISAGGQDAGGWWKILQETENLFGDRSAFQANTGAMNAMAKYGMTGDLDQLIADMTALGYVLQQTGEKAEGATDSISKYTVADEYRSTLNLSAAQAQAVEEFWDWWRVNANADYSDEEFDARWNKYESAFAGDSVIFGLMDGLMSRLYQSTPDASKLPEDFFITPELPEDTGEKLQGELNQLNLSASVALLPDLGMMGMDLSGITHAANGLYSVPYDGYPAILHKGERVMTAREAGNNYSSNLYVESMYMNNGMDAAGLAAAMAAAQRRTMAGYGS